MQTFLDADNILLDYVNKDKTYKYCKKQNNNKGILIKLNTIHWKNWKNTSINPNVPFDNQKGLSPKNVIIMKQNPKMSLCSTGLKCL